MTPILQWNARNIKNIKHELIFLIHKYLPTVFGISDTWLRPGALFRVLGYACLRDDRDDGWAGCALLVKRNTNHTTITNSQLPVPTHSTGLQDAFLSPAFLDFLDSTNLCVINDGSSTRRTSPLQNVSAPDLTLISPGLVPFISWFVLVNSFGSDHLPILISLGNSPPSLTPDPPSLLKYRLNQGDWDRYR